MDIAIVEDSKEDSEYLLRIIEEWASSNDIKALCHCYPSGEAFLAQFAPGGCQLVFLDIYMDGLTGIDTARIIRARCV